MNHYFGFTSDRSNIFFMGLDVSGSMDGCQKDMKRGLEAYKRQFGSFSEASSVAIAKCTFGNGFYAEPFKALSEFDTSYGVNRENTALYDAIVYGAKYLLDYMKQVKEKTGNAVRATFIIASDGGDNNSRSEYHQAKKTIENLNYAGITTVFVAFGEAINSKFGEKMGFMSVKDVSKDGEEIVDFFEQLSQSCKEQSKSLKALGANFFSRATSSSTGYSNKTEQVLEDEDWIDQL